MIKAVGDKSERALISTIYELSRSAFREGAIPMSRFYITQISASGEKVEYSTVDFKDGVNFLEGPSNTGKSYVIGYIDFMFGGKEIPFTRDDIGYDMIGMTMKSDDGCSFSATRKIEEGSNVVLVNTDYPGVQGNEFKISTKEYSDLLLKLMDIEKRTSIIGTREPKKEDLTIRTIFHFFFINEDYILEKKTSFDTPDHSKITKSLTSLIFFLNGDESKGFCWRLAQKSLKKEQCRKPVLSII